MRTKEELIAMFADYVNEDYRNLIEDALANGRFLGATELKEERDSILEDINKKLK